MPRAARARTGSSRTRASAASQGRPRRARSVKATGTDYSDYLSNDGGGSSDAAEPNSGSDAGVDLSRLSQKERRRIKNRESAAQSRQRKREELEGLHKQVRDLTRRNTSLNNKVKTLTGTVQRLKATKAALEANVAELTAELERTRHQTQQQHKAGGLEGGAASAGGAAAAAGRADLGAVGGRDLVPPDETGRVSGRPATGRKRRRKATAAATESGESSKRDTRSGHSLSDAHINNLLLSHSALGYVPRHHQSGQAAQSPRSRPMDGNGDHSSATSAAESIGSFPISNLLLGSSHGDPSGTQGSRAASFIGNALAARVPAFTAAGHSGMGASSSDSFNMHTGIDSSVLYGAHGLFPDSRGVSSAAGSHPTRGGHQAHAQRDSTLGSMEFLSA